MARKRRYYREERRRPVYWEDDNDDDIEEDDDSPEISDKFVKRMSWTLLAVLGFSILLSFVPNLYTPSESPQAGGGFRVVSVSKGQLHAEDLRTGKAVSFDDQMLVKAALNGSIKRGDVFYR